MPPLNLELLIAGDDAEWQRAYDEKGLWSLAYAVVYSFFVDEDQDRDRRQFVEDVALEVVAELVRVVREGRVNNVNGLRGMLRKIARDRSIDRIREHWFNVERAFPQPRKDDHDAPANQDDSETFLRGFFLEVLGEFERPLEAIIEEWAKQAALDVLEKALFREHIVHRCTIGEFGKAHQMHPSSVMRLKKEVLRKLRGLLGGLI
jgi:DNA-directed RNA polymerase specialized sigma24 family protein